MNRRARRYADLLERGDGLAAGREDARQLMGLRGGYIKRDVARLAFECALELCDGGLETSLARRRQRLHRGRIIQHGSNRTALMDHIWPRHREHGKAKDQQLDEEGPVETRPAAKPLAAMRAQSPKGEHARNDSLAWALARKVGNHERGHERKKVQGGGIQQP